MSYQAITDNIVNPLQFQDLQLSSSIKDSPKTTSSESFTDLVSFYKQETNATKEPETANENSTVKEKISENKTEKSAETEEEKISEEVTQKDEANSEKTEKKFENDNGTVKDDKKIELKNEDADDIKSKADKKLSSKDFARLNQIAEKRVE